jgi:hypothetical protein
MVKGGNILPSFGGCSKRKQTMDRTYGIYGTYVASAKRRRTPNAKRPRLFWAGFYFCQSSTISPLRTRPWRGKYERLCQHLRSAVTGFGGIET